MKRAARERDLRRVEAGKLATGFGPDPLAMAVMIDELTGLDTALEEFLDDAVAGKDTGGMGQEVDADAEGQEFGRRLVDADIMAFVGKGEGRRQSTDAAAGNCNPHPCPLSTELPKRLATT